MMSLGQPIHTYQQLDSTMDEAHRLAKEGAPEGTLVVALRQEQGRGRLGRAWVSPEGGAYLSLILRPMRPTAEVPQLALVTGLAAAEAIRDAAGVYPSIRWPNDLLLGGKKLGGTLVEARDAAVIVGIGINVSTPPEQLPPEATSLAAAGAGQCTREQIITAVCGRLSHWYAAWSKESFAPIREALRPWVGIFGHVVHLTAGSEQFEGTAQDIDERGRLVLRLDRGTSRAFDVGELVKLS